MGCAGARGGVHSTRGYWLSHSVRLRRCSGVPDAFDLRFDFAGESARLREGSATSFCIDQ